MSDIYRTPEPVEGKAETRNLLPANTFPTLNSEPLNYTQKPIQLGVLGSTRGTDLQAIIEAIDRGRLDASIAVVISNRTDAYILERARNHEIETVFIEPRNKRREVFDNEVSRILKKHHVELILLIGYMRILSPLFINTWRNRVLNVHPSLLPAFSGGMDIDVHAKVLESGVKVSGCTVHIATSDVDQGPIVVQKPCPIDKGETRGSLKEKVQALEGVALIEAVGLFQDGSPLFER